MASSRSTNTEPAVSYDGDTTPSERRERGSLLVREMVETAGVDGVVVNLSGGIDSSTTAALAVEAVGSDNVYGLCLPTLASTDANMHDAHTLTTQLEIAYDTVRLQPVLDLFEDAFAPEISTHGDRSAIGNVAARLRMACAYYAANTLDSLVVGTGNRTERLLGYFTKYGDGGVDLLPLGECYKTDVRRLARVVGVPAEIIEKPPTAGLWAGQTDKNELGASYGVLDPVCHQLIDVSHDATTIAETLSLDPSMVRQYAARNAQTAHKRTLPPATTRQMIDRISTRPTADPTTAFVAGQETLTRLRKELTAFIGSAVETAGVDGVVINMSGDTDSSVVATLAVRALGSDRVYGLVLPCGNITESTVFDAVALAESLGIEHTTLNVRPLVARLEEALPTSLTGAATVRSHANLVDRIRMLCAYYAANTMSRLVLGTTTRSEWLLGRFTKHGDGGVDLQPLTGLYTTEVRALAHTMDIPPRIIEQPSIAGIRDDPTDERAIGLAADDRDELLRYLVDADVGVEYTAEKCGVDVEVVERCAHDHIRTRHKRRMPPTPTSRKQGTTTAFFHELELLFGRTTTVDAS